MHGQFLFYMRLRGQDYRAAGIPHRHVFRLHGGLESIASGLAVEAQEYGRPQFAGRIRQLAPSHGTDGVEHVASDRMLEELRKVIPAFLLRVDQPERGGRWSAYLADTRRRTQEIGARLTTDISRDAHAEVILADFAAHRGSQARDPDLDSGFNVGVDT